MSKFTDWMHDDITWCGSECDNKDCFRNPVNRRTDGLFSMAMFKDTPDCQYSGGNENVGQTVDSYRDEPRET